MTTALVGYYDYDALRLRYRANASPAALGAYVLYEFDEAPGKSYRDDVSEITTFTTTWAESLIEGDPPGGSGGGCKIVGGGVWIRSSATSLVKGSMYARLLVARANSGQEECLACGYIYDAKPFLSIGEHEHIEMTDTVATMDVTYQQANVAGGAVVVEIVPGAGSAFDVLYFRVLNSGTNTIQAGIWTAAGGTQASAIVAIASAAATKASFPAALPASASSDTSGWHGASGDVRVVGTMALRIHQTGAGVQNDTFRILGAIRVKGALPTVSKANSTNEADVTVTAGAASFAFIA